MKLAAFILTAAILSTRARAATITVTITGATGEIRVGEGPIFEHRSYTLIPPGDPFSLTYTFDEEKGKQTISELGNGLISQSEIENTKLSSPGTSATLQIGRAVLIGDDAGQIGEGQVTLEFERRHDQGISRGFRQQGRAAELTLRGIGKIGVEAAVAVRMRVLIEDGRRDEQ